MPVLPDLTDKILAYPAVLTSSVVELADWAIEMLELGYETPNLLIVAGFSKPTPLYEALPYLEKACQELGLEPRTGEVATAGYCRYLVKQLTTGRNLRPDLAELHELTQEQAGTDTFDFSLLFWAWGDLEWGETYTDYRPDATLQNIERLVVETAKQWLATHHAPTD